MSMVPTVFIVDTDGQSGKRLARMLEKRGTRAVVFTSAREFSKMYRTTPPSCLVLNIEMPGLKSLEFQRHVSRSIWNTPVIFISDSADVATSVKAMQQGALDFLLKPVKEAQFLKAIRKGLQRALRLRQEIAARTQVHHRIASLTMREREVLLLVAAGMLNKQIAATLGTSEKTIKVHRGRVMGKMDVQSVAQLARMAERVGLPLPKLTGPPSPIELSREVVHLAALSLDLQQVGAKAPFLKHRLTA
jgi:FixJ family two-component response regulator